ncbi:hypothetical protein ACFXB5_36465, partial [Streptomyces sp. NPDC059455]
MADVRQQVTLSLITEFENFSVFKPGDYNVDSLNTLLDQVVAWSGAPGAAPRLRLNRLGCGRGPDRGRPPHRPRPPDHVGGGRRAQPPPRPGVRGRGSR